MEFGFSAQAQKRGDRDTELLRSELLTIEQLQRHAAALAERQRIAIRTGPDRLLARLAGNERILRDAYAVVTHGVAAGHGAEHDIAPTEGWLLDNYYLIEQQISLARRHLPHGYSRQLPQLEDGALAGFPRIYELALELISHQDGRVDRDNATAFLVAYQRVRPLRLGELWAFPIMLRLALLENLRRVGRRISSRRRERGTAVQWAEKLLQTAETEPKRLIQVLAEFASADVPLTAPFIEEFYARLQVQSQTMAFVQSWVESQLLEQGATVPQLLQSACHVAAATQISIANCIGSLRFIGGMDWRGFVEELSFVEQALREDPVGVYALQDFGTRDRYRHAVEEIAADAPYDELAVARAAVLLAGKAALHGHDRTAHVGYYLVDRGRHALEHAMECKPTWKTQLLRACGHSRLALYLTVIVLLAALGLTFVLEYLNAYGAGGWRYWLLALLSIPAAFALAVPVVNLLSVAIVPPRILPRLDFSPGIPDAHRTIVVVPTLLGSRQEVGHLLEMLEVRYLGNRDSNLLFALLTDYRDAPESAMPEDAELLELARSGIAELNARHAGEGYAPFYLFHRPRVWNPIEKLWMGWERKRGKLEQFNALLRGRGGGVFSEVLGDTGRLSAVQYVITLDTDTQLPRDSAKVLIGNLAHPLNRPVYDKGKGRVVEGYAVLQPRASASLQSANRSWFSRAFAGDAGMDPYTREVSDVYQDVFGEGSFVGKGIYDVDAFRRALEGRIPENVVLSHDLLEGAYACSGLVTDVDLIEEFPASYAVEASRRHRWIRGDWQVAGWLLPRVRSGTSGAYLPNPLSALSRWKIFDNLRRSLVPPMLLTLLACGWLFGPGPGWAWIAVVSAVLVLPPLIETVLALVRKPSGRAWLPHLLLAGHGLPHQLLLALLTLVLLPFEVWLSLHAIAQSALRLPFTRRGLLLWHTPAYARRNAAATLAEYFREMAAAPVAALALGGMLVAVLPAQLPYCLPLLLLWLAAPAIAWWISEPIAPPEAELDDEQRRFLRLLARHTWRYFDQFVAPLDNWLPPDNFQDHPAPMIANRTSPTNIGMGLLAHLAAHDFGYIGMGELLSRLENMLSSMEKLERYHGHLLNWYDTRTLQPLWPQYVSAVDSGNLVGALLTLRAGLAELKTRPVLAPVIFQGLEDTLIAVEKHLTPATGESVQRIGKLRVSLTAKNRPLLPADMEALLVEVQLFAQELIAGLAAEAEDELAYWVRALEQQTAALRQELRALLPEPQHFSRMPSLLELVKHEAFAAENLPPIAFAPGAATALDRLHVIDSLGERCRALAQMDFDFLYDPASCLLSIGYNVGERRRDPSRYDLLASEARLASFLLIAEGQLPQKHWFALGRLLTSQGKDVSLISWSGSMFEYLMPQLIMPAFDGTLLQQTCRAAVARQIEYGRQRGIPWGVSESCYNAVDMHSVYQYRAFGVPGLGFKRGLADDIVIAPYATALALMVEPLEACRNLQRLAGSGFLGAYGLYEAIDYTPSRVPPGSRHAVVRTFMAHHQGMSLLALAHTLLGQPMQRRFLSDPMVRTSELLLQERVPKKADAFSLYPHAAEVSAAARPAEAETGAAMRVIADPHTPLPEVHLLSNGRYHVAMTNTGAGYSHWNGLALTRWREDAVTDAWGSFVYLRDLYTGRYWSSAWQPKPGKPERYEAIFLQARAEYRRRDHALDAHTTISVSSEDDVEVRRLKLTNLSSHARDMEVTTYAEVVLAPLNADLAHRAFSNLFVQTEIVGEREAILCTRRRRTPEEQTPWMFHLLVAPGAKVSPPSFETDRARFLGRGRTPANPVVFESGGDLTLSNSEGPVLDPIVAVRRALTLAADETASIYSITGAAETREAALALVAKYADRSFAERAFEMAWFHNQEVLRQLNASEFDAQVYDRLAASVIHANQLRRAPAAVIARNRLGQPGLWRFAISGDLPIVLVRIADQSRVGIVRQMLQAHAYWRMKGLAADLVILNEDFSGYRAVLHDLIIGLINTGPAAQWLDKPGGVFVRRAEELSEEDRVLFQSVARVVIGDHAETLADQVEHRLPRERLPERRRGWRLGSQQRRVNPEATPDWLLPTREPISEPARPLVVGERKFFNGVGGFSADGREYVVTLEPGRHTPAPWVNVIASPHIGTVVSESGSAYTWAINAHEFRLTPFHNDPVSDPTGEAFYIRDEESGQFWSPAPLPARGRTGYVCRHGFGYSIFEHAETGIHSRLAVYVAMDAPVKLVVVKLRNQSGRMRRLSLTGYWELVLGEWRHASLMHIVSETDPQTGALFARNHYSREYAQRVVFAYVSEPGRAMTASRSEFIGRNGSLAEPMAMRRAKLAGRTGAGLDPCAALQAWVELGEGEEHEVVFLFGSAASTDEAQHLIRRFGGIGGARQAWDTMRNYWDSTLGAVEVQTPDPALDLLANGWLIYQTISCRLWGRSGYYQSGGAYGFRDQLQDTVALLHAAPWLTREQLLRCAGHQFAQGDVQHWWHPPNGQGVRTHFSDDYLWLPYAVCRYVEATGDTGVLDEPVAFLEGRPLNAEEEAYYDQPLRSTEQASLYEHCVRALKHGLRFGAHGLPLIGCGDWNDGMNLVGREGRGESVWLAWFLLDNLAQFARLADRRGDGQFATLCRSEAEKLHGNIEAQAWDGGWYRRAYFDDGTPLGSAQNDECRIDSISQSWAVISGAGEPERMRAALRALDEHLVRRDANLVQLLAPPFDKSTLEPGYIKGYVPGVRENGGQYTHAAIWAAMAYALAGDRSRAWELMGMLNPINHGNRPGKIDTYRVEPYVMCADIYGAPPHTGRGGWTWYTGAAGWMYRLILETLLGLRLEVDRLHIAPRIPRQWQGYVIRYRYRETPYTITLSCGGQAQLVIGLRVDGELVELTADGAIIPLVNDLREHRAEVVLD